MGQVTVAVLFLGPDLNLHPFMSPGNGSEAGKLAATSL